MVLLQQEYPNCLLVTTEFQKWHFKYYFMDSEECWTNKMALIMHPMIKIKWLWCVMNKVERFLFSLPSYSLRYQQGKKTGMELSKGFIFF